MDDLAEQVKTLTHLVAELNQRMALDAKEREHGDRELHTKVNSTVDLLVELKTDMRKWQARIDGLPDTVVAMRRIADDVKSNAENIAVIRATADAAHSRSSRNDKIITASILAGISSFVALVTSLAQVGVF